ncbi:MAG TPA: hypothetical protein VL614_23650, partial [Acetobacteraceae bacterium]|nr:hypothetical protein [Acetobacteraceae bacterium]
IRDVAKALIGVSARVESSGTIDGLDDGAATVIAAVKPGAFGAPLRGLTATPRSSGGHRCRRGAVCLSRKTP